MEKVLDNVLLKKIINFKKGLISKREILPLLTNLFFSYLKFYRTDDREIINEFYLFFISHLEKIISNYDEAKFKNFEVWFKKVIKNKFLNFLNTKNIKSQFAIQKANDVELENLIYEKENNSEYSNILDKLNLSRITSKEKEILKFKLGYVEDEDIRETILRKIEKVRKIEDVISFKYIKLLKIHSAMLVENDINKKEELKNMEKNIREEKRKLEKKLYSIKILPPDNIISKKLGLSKNTVSAFFSRIRKKIFSANNKDIAEKIYN